MYVDAVYLQKQDKILVCERVDGKRVTSSHQAEHTFYYSHPAGQNRSIYDDPCKKFRTNDSRKFQAEIARVKAEGRTTFESDIKPVIRHLAKHYPEGNTPVLNIGLFDIEADYHAERGYAPADDPFNAVTAITLHESYTGVLTTLVLRPPTVTPELAAQIVAKFPDSYLFDDEAEMLQVFLGLIEDIDVLSGWNSLRYDIPYLVNRVAKLLNREATKQFCLWNMSPREVEKKDAFGNKFKTFELCGRIHLDYMDLYKKHNTQQQHSYRLDYIGEIEVGENKVPYEGNLDDLYKKEFERFIGYSRQDVMLLVKIDKKRKFIELANQIAHANTVLLPTTMGTVSLVENAIINEIHQMGFVAPDRKPRSEEQFDENGDLIEEEHAPVVGAYVADPKKGIHEWVAATDINSLYPSALRALNMSPETIFAQVRSDATAALIQDRIASGTKRADAWEGLFSTIEFKRMHDRTDDLVTVDFEDKTTRQITAAQLHDYVFEPANHVCISANGTIFRTDKEGIIPALLAKWYSQRQEMQRKAKHYAGLAAGIEIDPELAAQISALM